MKIPIVFLTGKKLRKQSAPVIAVFGIVLILSGERLMPSFHFIYLGAAFIVWSVTNDVTWRGLKYMSKGRAPAVMISYFSCAYGIACIAKSADPDFWRPIAEWAWSVVLLMGLFGIFETVAVMLARYRSARDGAFHFKPRGEELCVIFIQLSVVIFTMILCAGLNSESIPAAMTADGLAMLVAVSLYAMGSFQKPEIIIVKKS